MGDVDEKGRVKVDYDHERLAERHRGLVGAAKANIVFPKPRSDDAVHAVAVQPARRFQCVALANLMPHVCESPQRLDRGLAHCAGFDRLTVICDPIRSGLREYLLSSGLREQQRRYTGSGAC